MFKPRAFLFDLDNTLINRREMFKVFSELFVTHFMPDFEDHRRAVETLRVMDNDGYGARPELYDRLFGELNVPEPAHEVLIRFWNTVQPECVVAMPEMDALLEGIRSSGAKLALVTNGYTELQSRKIEKAGIGHYFDAVLISEKVGYNKPDRRIFEMALERLDVSADESVFVGDHPVNDIHGAQNAGIRAVWMNPFGETDCGGRTPFMEIKSLHELFALIA